MAAIATTEAQSYVEPATAYGGGDGSRGNPYLISTAGQLAKLADDMSATANFSRGKYFKMTADIVINDNVLGGDSAKMNDGKQFTQLRMIGDYTDDNNYNAFQGVFDGNGHVIKGLYLCQEANSLGLFRVIEKGTVKNLGIEDSYVHGNSTVGILSAKTFEDAKIINCHATNCRVECWGSYLGGIVAQMLKNSKLSNSYASNVRLYGKNNVAGLIGRVGNNDDATVTVDNCYAWVAITTTKANKAGITAENNATSTVSNCYYNSDLPKAITSDKGTTENVTAISSNEFNGDELINLLNNEAASIAGACRWQKGNGAATFDFTTFTPDADYVDVNALATDPFPSDKDYHANLGSAAILSWALPADSLTAVQYLYFGTDSAAIANATTADAYRTLALDSTFDAGTLSSMNVYYWRIDRATADGTVTKGTVWSFQPAHLAFRGAEGYGRFARGGRGGKVVYVTNLNNSGEGSLRWALTNGSGPRTVMFKVSGVIDQEYKTIRTDPNVTIAAQTAPGKGICVYHADLGIGSDNVVRFLRARRGLGTPDDTGNALGTVYSDYSIVDHTSMSWGTDETFSSRSSKNITLQRSMIAEALGIAGHRNYSAGTNHGYAATIGGDVGSFHHNLLADCYGRNWSMGGGADANGKAAGRLDMFNNVVYNWGSRTTDGGAMLMQFVNNYYKMGIDTKQTILFSADNELGGTRQQFAYVSGNIRDNKNGSLSTDKLGDTYRATGDDQASTWSDVPFFDSHATIESAKDAYKSTLSDNGANQPVLDEHDKRMISETLNRTYTYVGSKSGIKGEIDDEADAGGLEVYPETTWGDNYDTDGDGLPDWWEKIAGTNTNSPSGDFTDSNSDADGDGYTALDDYLDFTAQPHFTIKPNSTLTVNMKPYFAGYTNAPQFSVDSQSSTVTASVSDSILTVKALENNCIAEIIMTVTDAEGSTYSRRMMVAVTDDDVTSIGSLQAVESAKIKSFEVYDTSGVKLMAGTANGSDINHLDLGCLANGLYIIKAIDNKGKAISAKVIKY